jgi:putative hydrolase of HD superfamily
LQRADTAEAYEDVMANKPSEVVDRQVSAYNARDIDTFVACYATTAMLLAPDGSILAAGHAEICSHYGALFERSPNLHAVVRSRIELGALVIDEEVVTGFVRPGMPPTMVRAAVAYRVVDDVIERAQLLGME